MNSKEAKRFVERWRRKKERRLFRSIGRSAKIGSTSFMVKDLSTKTMNELILKGFNIQKVDPDSAFSYLLGYTWEIEWI